MIFRSKQPELTNDGYARWLRAQRPPLQWFLALSAVEPETLADLGDANTEEHIEALALALTNPAALAAGADVREAANDPTIEESMIRQVAGAFAARIQQARGAPQKAPTPPGSMPRETLAGFGERHTETHTTKGGPRRPDFLGKAPDEVVAP